MSQISKCHELRVFWRIFLHQKQWLRNFWQISRRKECHLLIHWSRWSVDLKMSDATFVFKMILLNNNLPSWHWDRTPDHLIWRKPENWGWCFLQESLCQALPPARPKVLSHNVSFFPSNNPKNISASAVSGEQKLWQTQTTRGGTRASFTQTLVATSSGNECSKSRSGTMIGSGPTNF